MPTQDISYNSYDYKVVALADKATRGNQVSDTTAYIATKANTIESIAATENLYQYYRENYPDLAPMLRLDGEQLNDRHVLINAQIDYANTSPISFNTTGATTHLNQSLATRGIYAAPGKVAPDYQGAIGVSDSGVAGIDVTVPAFEFSLRKTFEFVSTAYLAAIISLTGKVNNDLWSVFAAGESLFLGADGGENDRNWVDVTYHFAARPNETNLTIGNISGVSKHGWDYLWVKHGEEVVGDRVLQRPEAAYVEQVYPYANFAVLGVA